MFDQDPNWFVSLVMLYLPLVIALARETCTRRRRQWRRTHRTTEVVWIS